MWRNYVIIGLRALTKNKVYAFINIFGLSLGIAACLLILTYVRYEFSYNAWLPDADRAFQLQTDFHATPSGGLEVKSQTTAYAAATAVRKDFPQFDRVVYATGQGAIYVQSGQPTTTDNTVLTDGPLFDVIQVPFVRGDPAHSLDDPHSLVISESEARKRYGTEDPIGRTLTVISGDMTADYRVTGVFKDIPKNSTFRMTIVARIDPVDYFRNAPPVVTSWRWQNGQIFVRLKPGADIRQIQAQMPAWEKRNIPDDLGPGPKTNPGDSEDFLFANVRDIHLDQSRGPATTTDPATVLTFAVVALLILAMACMNFTNLATARASQRAREVALRKVLGATRRQLIIQFIGESMLVSGLATLLALALAELTLPWLNAFLDAQMQFNYLGAHGILLPVIGLALLVGLAGGVYPAFYLSRFQPARILKANKSAANAEGSGRLRNLLVVTQFAVSIGLIICTAIVYSQTIYARSVDAGYKKEGLIQLNGIFRPQVESVGKSLTEEIRKQPGIADAARVGLGVATGNNSSTDVFRIGSQEPVELGIYGIDTHAIDTLGMRLIAGRNFSESIATDDSTVPSLSNPEIERRLVARGNNVILSESAVRRMGFSGPAAAIGQRVQSQMVSSPTLGMVTSTIVGVVSDVRYRTARDPVQPILYFYETAGFNQMLVRFNGKPTDADARIAAVWKRMVPDIPYASQFVTEVVHDLYDADETRAQLFGMFAILAVVIGCLGLFGLAAFTAEQRTKEIGIRKVLGAHTWDIIRLLVWQFSRPVLIANLIAWPVAWWVMRGWLNQFDVRIGLGPTPFIGAALIALLIAVATIGAHAFRVARTNPIHALRYE
ncbi:ABC transporter permease [Sphingomonas sp. JC676]|uniref:ABC transporter permease n=1 Tax=Sphingomonas sp. JC676 TaxID=2768065 RepID=UPI001657DBBE|nr:ABC transporter permease [Sphingomonas sp. JC676]MBC9032490.1 ABC transporter permease [Sphingomonas sp. JC676]